MALVWFKAFYGRGSIYNHVSSTQLTLWNLEIDNEWKILYIQGCYQDRSIALRRLKSQVTWLFNGLLRIWTNWGRVTHICVGNLTIIGSDNGLSPGRCQAIIWTSAGILLIWPVGTNFSEILIGVQTFSFKKMHLKMSSAKWRPFCPGLNVLTPIS